MSLTTDFVCLRSDCGNTWSMEADEDGLFDGHGRPLARSAAETRGEASDRRDWGCPHGYSWRIFGNGGLVRGMVPSCPECEALPIEV